MDGRKRRLIRSSIFWTRARWDAEKARGRIRSYVVEELYSREAVLIVDETGFLKKGQHSAAVKRQYSGAAGCIENSQIGVFLCYASDQGSALVDRELYIPQEWAEDRERRREAGIPGRANSAQSRLPDAASNPVATSADQKPPPAHTAPEAPAPSHPGP